jgi:predicted alpha/beta-hydrolase family hydrolase
MTELTLFSTPYGSELPAILHRPTDADTLFVLGHGSGSTIHVPFMAALSDALGNFRIASLRFEYPYSSDPNFIPFSDMPLDADEVLIETVRAALKFGLENFPELKALVGGHSISGLVATYADADVPLQTAGLVSLGFPRKGDPARSQHLLNTSAPLLFVQGTNDALGSQREIEEMTGPLGDRATMKWIEGATHGFGVEGRKLSHVVIEIAEAVRQFADQI